MRRRLVLASLTAVLLASLPGCKARGTYPDRPIFIVCPWGAGGGTDQISRQMAVLLERELGVAVNVVNATGGQGVTGHGRGARARPDGHTLTMMTLELNMLHWRALLVPVAFHLEAVHAIAAMVTLVACAIFAGDIPNTLLRIPGTPASAAYTDDVHAFTKRGLQEQALGVCLVFSVAGGLLGSLALVLFAQSLARVARLFGMVEYFWLYLLGLGCAEVATRGSPLRAALGLIVGLALSTVGLTRSGAASSTWG